ncbi:FecR family protein [Carboxylicivirga taeanensis]|uniref:FecR family protein n=1 Tax=Carboxylicivirga taeanensis TaxID=1416875 RepID=UPI003F6DE534
MSKKLQHITTLIKKYVDGTASAQEVAAIYDWISESEANKLRFVKIKEQVNTPQKAGDDWQRFTNRYGEQLKTNRRSKRMLGFISLAASISLVVGVSFYLLKPQKSIYADYLVETEEIPEYTTLSFSNGEQLALKNTHSIVEVEEEGSIVSIDKEQLVEAPVEKADEKPGVNQIIVPYGKTAQVSLADGTKVWLNAGSKLLFPVHFDRQSSREVMLFGEAFFDVSHNASQPFKVITDEMIYTVLGTTFNIQSYENSASVSAVLVNGSLQVEKKAVFDKQKTILEPGQMSQYTASQDKISVSAVNTAFYTSWKDGYLMLNKNSLSKLIQQIEHYYNSELIITNELLNIPSQLSGKLLLDDDPEQVYQALCDLTGMTYEIINNRVEFRKQKKGAIGQKHTLSNKF